MPKNPSVGLSWTYSYSCRHSVAQLGLKGPRCSHWGMCQLMLAAGLHSSVPLSALVAGVSKAARGVMTHWKDTQSLEKLSLCLGIKIGKGCCSKSGKGKSPWDKVQEKLFPSFQVSLTVQFQGYVSSPSNNLWQYITCLGNWRNSSEPWHPGFLCV